MAVRWSRVYAIASLRVAVSCVSGHLEVVELLIAHKCNMNLVNIDGDTALHMAMDESRDQVAKVTH